MKIQNLSRLAFALLALTAVGCVQEDLNFKDGGDAGIRKSMTVKVVDGGYQDKLATRAGESNEEETEGGSTVMRTRFMAGDKIGVFSISSGGATHYKNLELVYDGTEWKNPDGETFFYFSGMKYFAYYPYTEDFDMDKLDWSRDSAAGFFASYINDWMPLEDQSTTRKYIASDLMVGNGALTDDSAFTFSLGHTMGLIFISAAEEIKGTVYLFPKLSEADAMENLSAESKIYSFEQKIYKASRKQGYYRYLVKPGQAKFISGRNPDGMVFSFTCENVSAGCYKKYIIDGGFNPSNSEIEDFTVQLGDVLFNDMHIEHRPADESKVKGSPAGIISYLAELNDEYTEGYIHGLVLAGKNANTSYGKSWSYSQYTEEMADNPALTNCLTIQQAIDDKSGLSNCLAVGYTEGLRNLTTDHTSTLPIYEKASPWFFPSAGQWIKIICAWGGTITSPLNRTGTISFSYESIFQPGVKNMFEDINYLWTPFFARTYKGDDSPGNNKNYLLSSTESSKDGAFIWLFNVAKTGGAPQGGSYKKSDSYSKDWRALAF